MDMQDELRRRLIKLATTCDTVEKQLEKRVKVADTILIFSEMCRKLEAEEEKVLPFYASTLTEEERAEVEAAFYEQPFENLAKVIFNIDPLIALFQHPLGHVHLRCARNILEAIQQSFVG